MRRIKRNIGIFLLAAAPWAWAGEAGDRNPYGMWLTEKEDTVVRIEQCSESLCGYVTWIHPDETQRTPDGEPICNQKVMWDFEQSSSDRDLWKGGKIYKADEDKKYSGRIRVLGMDEIRVRGFIGLPFLGKSYTLSRVQDSEYPSCNTAISRQTETPDG